MPHERPPARPEVTGTVIVRGVCPRPGLPDVGPERKLVYLFGVLAVPDDLPEGSQHAAGGVLLPSGGVCG